MTTKEAIERYAHDYRDIPLSEQELNEMLWSFWKETEAEMRQIHLEQVASRINSHGFMEWYNK